MKLRNMIMMIMGLFLIMATTMISVGGFANLAQATANNNNASNNKKAQPIPTSQQFVESVKDLLQEFTADPKTFMQKTFLQKEDGKNGVQRKEKFTQQYINQSAPNQFVEGKDEWRLKILCGHDNECIEDMKQGKSLVGRAQFEPNDDPSKLVDQPHDLYTTLDEMEKAGLSSASLSKNPWSDDYWPIYRGILGSRYASSGYLSDQTWIDYYLATVSSGFTLQDLWSKVSSQSLDQFSQSLSPSEKYDLLIGKKAEMANSSQFWEEALKAQLMSAGASNLKWEDKVPQGFLTPSNWFHGQLYRSLSDEGKVEPWMGICDGWAISSYLFNRPRKSVVMVAADGKTEVKFYPADIKALTSYSMARQRVPTKFIGGRCNIKKPDTDKETGRVLDQKCFDTNPGAFHIAIVNQIGKNERSLVMDATYDYEVWNQPINGFHYIYFDIVAVKNTATQWKRVARPIFEGQVGRGLRWSSSPRAWNERDDRFWKFRFKRRKSGEIDWDYYQKNIEKLPYWVVGVAMEVEYMVETNPYAVDSDTPDMDATQKVTYIYDLELNADGKVIGGEWFNNAHPDFLWSVPPSVKKNKLYFTEYDRLVRVPWDGSGVMPVSWQQVARMAAYDQKPLAKIIDVLIEKANR